MRIMVDLEKDGERWGILAMELADADAHMGYMGLHQIEFGFIALSQEVMRLRHALVVIGGGGDKDRKQIARDALASPTERQREEDSRAR